MSVLFRQAQSISCKFPLGTGFLRLRARQHDLAVVLIQNGAPMRRRMAVCRKLVNAIVCDKEYTEKSLFELKRLTNVSSFQAFLDEEPTWIPKLQQWMLRGQRRIAWRQWLVGRSSRSGE